MVLVTALAVIVVVVVGIAGLARSRSRHNRWERELAAVRGEALLRPDCDELPAPVDPRPSATGHPAPTPVAEDRLAPPPAGGVSAGRGTDVAPHDPFGVDSDRPGVRTGGGALVADRPGDPAGIAHVAGGAGWVWFRPPSDAGRQAAVAVRGVTVHCGPGAAALVLLDGPSTTILAVEGCVSVRVETAALWLGCGGLVRVAGDGSPPWPGVARPEALLADPVVAANLARDGARSAA